MKKIIPLIIALVVAITVYHFGMRNYYKEKYPWEYILKTQLEKFSDTRDNKELDAIVDLYKTYSFDLDIMSKMQSKADETVKSWYEFVKQKYICDTKNINTCALYKKDLDDVVNYTITKIYVHKGYENYSIISWDVLDVITKDYEEIKKKITSLEADPNSTRQKDYETIRKEKCATATECNDCKNGMCYCIYIDPTGSKKDIVPCKDEKKVVTNY